MDKVYKRKYIGDDSYEYQDRPKPKEPVIAKSGKELRRERRNQQRKK